MEKKIVLCSTAEKKLFAFDKDQEKNCSFKLAVEKSLIKKKNHSPPPPIIKWSAKTVAPQLSNDQILKGGVKWSDGGGVQYISLPKTTNLAYLDAKK